MTTGSVARVPIPESSWGHGLVLKSPDGSQQPILLNSPPPDRVATTEPAAADNTAPSPAALPPSIPRVTVGPLELAGLWELRAKGATDVLPDTVITELACNLSNSRESDVRTPEDLLSKSAHDPLHAAWFSRPLWFYCAMAALALAFIEWSLYQRRLIR
jgi:hypothetical protein